MKVLLLSTYELGRQPFALASATSWLRSGGHEVSCLDLSIQKLDPDSVRGAEFIGIYLPMHTAARLAIPVIDKIRNLNPSADLCCFGLYASLNEPYLRNLGVRTILGGEFEHSLLNLAKGEQPERGLDRLRFLVPDRSTLPPLNMYGRVHVNGDTKLTGYTETTRGCKHRCRHCPIVPVYDGQFRAVQGDIVLEDIRRQVALGAMHVTFGDPDFFNGPAHAMRIVEALHREFPQVTYDVTIKIEHLRRHRDLVPRLGETGCLFVISAVESLDDEVLAKLEKGHTREDFIRVVEDFRRCGLTLAPTFIAFTPWTTVESYCELLRTIAALDIIENVSPVQLALRLLITAGSRLLELEEVRAVITAYDEAALLHRWKHADPEVDALAGSALKIAARRGSRLELFGAFWELAHGESYSTPVSLVPRAAIPYMDEPWYC